MPKKRPAQLDSPLLPKIFKYAGKVHVGVCRRTGGKIGGEWRIGANPDTHIEIGPDRRAVHAVTANPEERARLWPNLVDECGDSGRDPRVGCLRPNRRAASR